MHIYEWVLAVGSQDSVLLGTLKRIMYNTPQIVPVRDKEVGCGIFPFQIRPQQYPPGHNLFLQCDLEVPLFKGLGGFATLVEVVLYDIRSLDLKGDTVSSCFSWDAPACRKP